MDYAQIDFADLEPIYDLSWAYTLTYRLPETFAGSELLAYIDLFDNGNSADSVGYVRNVRINSAATPEPSFVEVWSSASPQGPFARESGVTVDLGAKTLRLPRGGVQRFYRLSSVVRAVLVDLQRTPEADSLAYVFDPEQFLLEVAPSLWRPHPRPCCPQPNPWGLTLRRAEQRWIR